jgi:hypothetical protein
LDDKRQAWTAMACSFWEVHVKIADSHLRLLLRLIAGRGSIEPLLKRGLTYAQVWNLIGEALDGKLIIKVDQGYVLTALGTKRMRSDPETGKSRSDGGWILPEEESRIEKKASEDVYLPHLRKSSFKI